MFYEIIVGKPTHLDKTKSIQYTKIWIAQNGQNNNQKKLNEEE